MTGLRSVSYGGGVQSTALLVLAAQRRIDFPLFLMSNVGDDSEHPASLDYVRNIAMPYAEKHGIELVLLDRIKRDGSTETLMGRLVDPRRCPRCKGEKVTYYSNTDDQDAGADPDLTESRECPRCHGEGTVESRSLPIPIRMSNGAPGTRSCTADFKIAVIAKELKRRGATAAEPATIGIGISLDEIHRANSSRRVSPHERVVYPLIGIGEETGLKLRRDDCVKVIRDEGLPVPPKSSCFFCPFHRPETWADMRRNEPDLFEKSADLEDLLNKRRTTLGKDPVWLTRFNMPLREAIHDDLPLFDLNEGNGSCDSGWCMT